MPPRWKLLARKPANVPESVSPAPSKENERPSWSLGMSGKKSENMKGRKGKMTRLPNVFAKMTTPVSMSSARPTRTPHRQ